MVGPPKSLERRRTLGLKECDDWGGCRVLITGRIPPRQQCRFLTAASSFPRRDNRATAGNGSLSPGGVTLAP